VIYSLPVYMSGKKRKGIMKDLTWRSSKQKEGPMLDVKKMKTFSV